LIRPQQASDVRNFEAAHVTQPKHVPGIRRELKQGHVPVGPETSVIRVNICKSNELVGRTLKREIIFLGKRTFTTNVECDWSTDLFGDVLVAVKITNWLLVCTDKDSTKAQDFINCLTESCQEKGIKISSRR